MLVAIVYTVDVYDTTPAHHLVNSENSFHLCVISKLTV